MDYHSLDEKTIKIIENIETLNNKISLIKKKILKIKNVNEKLEKNKILKQDVNSNLRSTLLLK